VLTGLKSWGVEDILITCMDNLTEFDETTYATFTQAELQNRIIHQLRNPCKCTSYRDLKPLSSQNVLRRCGQAVLDVFGELWDKKYPKSSQFWQANLPNLSVYFKQFREMHGLSYTTNTIKGSTASCAR